LSGIVSVALADLRQRTRTFTMFLVVAVALQVGFLLVPDASATYATVNLGGSRGIYNSAWMGTTTAIFTAALLPLAGFFLVRPGLHRDVLLGTHELVVSAPIARVRFVLGKFVSNVVVLAGVALVLVAAAVVMQLVRDESRTIEFAAYAWPYSIVTLPTCALTAACTIVVDTARPLRGIGGAILWFFVWTTLLSIPAALTVDRMAAFDPLGFTLLTSAVVAGLHHTVPGADAHQSMAFGIVSVAGRLRTFPFDGIHFTGAAVLTRIGWLLASVASCALVGRFAFDLSASAIKTRPQARFAGFVARFPLPLLGRIALTQALSIAGIWWIVGMLALAGAALVVPLEVLGRVIAPLIWVWPVGPVAVLSTQDARAGVDDLLRATPIRAAVRVLWRWLAALSLAIVPVIALAVRDGAGGIALIAILCASVACGIALGALTRAQVGFEALALAAWYVGPLNRVPIVDPQTAVRAPLVTIGIATAVTIIALGTAAVRSAWRG